MKKILAFLCASILLVSLCAACQSKELPDTYVEGSDYQYMQLESRRFFMMQSQGSKAFYLLHGNYIYFIDEGSDMILPLCNKADCLHDKETDPEKYSYCNACILPENKLPLGDAGISYCNGFLYCLDCGYAGQTAYLYRISEDGSKKETIYQWDGCLINEWAIHRDVLYYAKEIYETTDDRIKARSQLMSLSLTDPVRQEEVVFVPDEDLTINSLARPSAYGNHVYFVIHGFVPAEEEITDDNYLEYLYNKAFEYNIVTKEIHELVVPNMNPTQFVSSVAFWDDKLLLHAFDHATDETGTDDWYITELDGSNPELFMEDVPKYTRFTNDGTYLYMTNAYKVARGYAEEDELIYEVYNRQMEKVDTFKPMTTLIFYDVFPIGNDVMYLPYSSGDENDPFWGVVRWDKKIGTYQGAPVDKDIVDIRYT